MIIISLYSEKPDEESNQSSHPYPNMTKNHNEHDLKIMLTVGVHVMSLLQGLLMLDHDSPQNHTRTAIVIYFKKTKANKSVGTRKKKCG
jgi:hypothetical protein